MGRRWKRLGSALTRDLGLFQVRLDQMQNPRTGGEMQAIVLEMQDAVTVVALTQEQRVVVVRQFRFGIDEVTSEIPAGLIDRDEAPLGAAIRELREETGHTADAWESLGWVHPNPAYQNNRCHLFLARGARLTHELSLDPGEDIHSCTLDAGQLAREIRQGRMRHAITLLALARVPQLWEDIAEAMATDSHPAEE